MNKMSQFSTFVPYQDKFIAYNAFTNSFLLMEPLLCDLCMAAKYENKVDDLAEIHPELYQSLLEKGFIVSSEVNEVDKVRALRESIDFDDSFYHIIINPTMNCNFKCWYCYEDHIKDSKMDSANIDKVKKLITNILQEQPNLKRLIISWFGGEPLLYYKQVISPLLSFAFAETEKRGIEFTSNFTTNGLLLKKEMIADFKLWHVDGLQITLDGRQEDNDKIRFISENRGSYREIVQNIKMLCLHEIHVNVRINYTHDNFHGLLDILNDFKYLSVNKRKFMGFSFNKVWQEKNLDTDVVNGMIRNYRVLGFEANTNHAIDSVRNSCYADKRNQATINYNGEVFKCTARDFTTTNSEGLLDNDGKIIWSEKFEKRMNIKFKNKNCLSCNILPICNGGCSQYALDNIERGFCVYEDQGIDKNDVIIQRFLQNVEN